LKTLAAMSVSIAFCICAEGQQAPPDAQQSSPSGSQASSPASSSASSSSDREQRKPERRFSGGLTLSVLGLSLVPGASNTVNNTSEISTQNQTKGASERIGYGLTGQARVTNHFYVDVGALIRRIGYQLTSTVSTTTTSILNGTSYPSTTTTDTHEDTRARLIDIPVALRYYGTGKRPGGARWFVEAGGAWRVSTGIRTSIDSTDASGTNTCCSTTPTVPANRSAKGLLGGAGVQLVDDFGIHVVPEVRYTRWVNPIFENLSTNTRENQVEAAISLTF
jgi:hypothetical protein